MKSATFALILALAGSSLSACSRKDGGSAGKGGKASLSCSPAHHGSFRNIINAKVFIKYNAQDLPGSFDDSMNCSITNNKATATFSGLRTGNYYVYARATDTTIGSIVEGGIPFTLSEESAQAITIPVTEGD